MTTPIESARLESAREIRNLLRVTYNETLNIIAQCDAGTVTLHDLVSARLSLFDNSETKINALALVPGVGAAYENLYPEETFDGDTEIAASSAALGVLADYVATQIPKDGADRVLTLTLVGRELVQETATGATPLGNLKTQCELYTATLGPV